MFEISKNCSIKLEIFQNSKIYIIDNFYENPNSIVEYFLNIKPELWKDYEKPSYNGVYFEDRRHIIESEKIKETYDFLSFLCGQNSCHERNLITTNASRFKRSEFNNYKENYWWPHPDYGYTGIVYLNVDDDVSGTNLYDVVNPEEEFPDCPEHYAPWRNKKNFKVIKTFCPRYNRLVLFNGLKFIHGMNICNDDYFGENYRFNQVFFFKDNGNI